MPGRDVIPMFLPVDSLNHLTVAQRPSRRGVQSLHKQGSSAVNEDVLLLSDTVYGVFDGATSLGTKRPEYGITGGYLAARISADVFQNTSGDLPSAAEKANSRIGKAWSEAGCDSAEKSNLWATSLAVIKVWDNVVEYCQSGDSAIIFLMRDGGFRCVGAETDIDSETLHMWKNVDWHEGLTIYEALPEQIRKVRRGMNREYGVLNGEPEAMNFLNSGELVKEHIEDILLFTDGLTIPQENPCEEYDWQSFVNLYKEAGLYGVHDHIHKLQESDPHCRLYPRFKQYDDVAAITLSMEAAI